MSTRKETIYVTKYALTTGIYSCEAEIDDDKDYVRETGDGLYYPQFRRLGKDAFLAIEEAVVAAEHMRTRKIGSLKRSLQRMRDIQFKPESIKPRGTT